MSPPSTISARETDILVGRSVSRPIRSQVARTHTQQTSGGFHGLSRNGAEENEGIDCRTGSAAARPWQVVAVSARRVPGRGHFQAESA
jgi:hypothetical protein